MFISTSWWHGFYFICTNHSLLSCHGAHAITIGIPGFVIQVTNRIRRKQIHHCSMTPTSTKIRKQPAKNSLGNNKYYAFIIIFNANYLRACACCFKNTKNRKCAIKCYQRSRLKGVSAFKHVKEEMYENIKWIIRSRKSQKVRQHRKLKIKKHELH
jgi:hypothetical protein